MAELKLTPSDDTRAYNNEATTNYGSSETTVVRYYTGGPTYDLAYFKWDLSTAPPASSINTAKFYFYVTIPSADIDDVNTYQINADWAEDTLTYNNKPGVTGDNLATFDVTSTGWKNGDITSIVKDWINGDKNNYGIRLWNVRSRNQYATIATKENTTESYRPYLLIDYTLAGGILNWWFFKEAWEKHDKLWTPTIPKLSEGYSI